MQFKALPRSERERMFAHNRALAAAQRAIENEMYSEMAAKGVSEHTTDYSKSLQALGIKIKFLDRIMAAACARPEKIPLARSSETFYLPLRKEMVAYLLE